MLSFVRKFTTSVSHVSCYVMTISISRINVSQTKRQIKKILLPLPLMVQDCVNRIGCLQNNFISPYTYLAVERHCWRRNWGFQISRHHKFLMHSRYDVASLQMQENHNVQPQKRKAKASKLVNMQGRKPNRSPPHQYNEVSYYQCYY